MSFIILFLCIWGLWLIVPESLITGYIKKSVEGSWDIKIEMAGFKKGIFYTLRAEQGLILYSQALNRTSRPSVNQEIKPILVIHDVFVTPDLASLLKLTPRLNFSGQLNHGTIQGYVAGRLQGAVIFIAGEDIQINGLPITERAGVYGDGILKFNYQGKDREGEVKFSIDDAKLKGAFTGINALPLNMFRNVKGLLTIEGASIAINSLTMEGEGIYVRIKGFIEKNNFDGNIEIMMDAAFDLYPTLKSLLARYKVVEGFYVIPYVHKI
ncbi:MAG: type II secretion system protein GspN [Syntrophales bacterium]